MIEVEIKVSLKDEDSKKILEKLKSLGFEKEETKEQVDTYFNGIDRDFQVTDEALRIRKSLNLDSNKGTIYVTYKGKKLDSISKTREEIEVEILDMDLMYNIFEKLGFKPVHPIRKIRKIYKKEDIEVSFDTVDCVGDYLEIEKVVDDDSKREQALLELLDLLKSLNISNDKLEKRSYLELWRGNCGK
ncbi:class IV adenylate cyclase [Methanococcus maripaludis]|uniref:Adenylate cyclase class 2 n=1 Tax=Methanococcus maripaludis TaxID=39152 RepID=A0A2L1CCS0_METMI|nr:class IV adenylate cyclase [Methanococcus maripaludis]AVB77157.1 CYTH domain protein [Methanococcus maripaludis]MBA2863668.1 adenylate cyclase class 2 [Methanococcus maripaludis]MBB6496326.1 adenylate cyclase class 2 [Methanococcus maripaludis]